ncbi:metallophosphoesterase [Rhizobium sp. Leaf341]|uniref:metallophosphoesterase n=1 Tax=Rhizobium sp. Leaf341 TaxID=1736344 RepID=UPI000714A03E|nr:metallophosphoesterase [Rhizobium sp. Leaf341]KQR75822.1 metallophosphoesterase [Rhizobium sp. Leaf341]
MLSRRGFLRTAGALVLAALSTAAYGIGIEPRRRPRVVTHRIVPPGWPRALRLRLVLISDLHACDPYMPASRIAEIADQANRLGGDMILLLGDFLSGMMLGTQVPPDAWGAALRPLQAPLGVHAILGNHDWLDDRQAMESGRPGVVKDVLDSLGVPLYENRAVRLEKDGQAFWLAGLADQLLPARGLDDLAGTLARITDDAPVILMAHEPDVFPTVPARVAVTLSGHTHGGQIRLFGFAPVVPSRFGSRYAYGHIVENGRHLVVSGGLGTSVIPVRLGSPPEITVVELG